MNSAHPFVAWTARTTLSSLQSRPNQAKTDIVKPKRTGLDVLKQLHTVTQMAQSRPACVEKAMLAMTPEQLRKAHEGLAVIAQCIGETPAAPAASASPSPSTNKPAPAGAKARPQPAVESS